MAIILTCKHCNFRWRMGADRQGRSKRGGGEMLRLTCPSCGHKLEFDRAKVTIKED